MINTKKNVLRFASIFLIFFLAFSFSCTLSNEIVAFADDNQSAQSRMAELQKELEQVRARLSQLNKDIANGKNAAEAAKQRKAALQREAAIIEEQIMIKKDEIDGKNAEIDIKHKEIAQKQQEFDENETLFKERMVAIYKMNNAGMLSTLLAVTSFSEFLTVTKNLQRISKNDTDFLDEITTQRVELDRIKLEMENIRTQLEAERAELDLKLEEYRASIAEQDAIYSAAVQQIAVSEAEAKQALEEINQMQSELESVWASLGGSAGDYIGGALGWPVQGYAGTNFISSYFGWRTVFGQSNYHTGIDIAGGGINGKPISAANSGTVVYIISNSNSGYGNYVIIDHGGGIRTLYAHCSSILGGLFVGQMVARGDTIAYVGSTGRSTGPHLHFEIRLNNTEKCDPLPYLMGQKEL